MRRKLLFVVAGACLLLAAVLLLSPAWFGPSRSWDEAEWQRTIEENRVLTAKAEASAAQGKIAETIEALEQRPFGFNVDQSFEHNTMEVLLRNSDHDMLVEYLEGRTPVDGGRCRCSDFDNIKRMIAIVAARTGAFETADRILPLFKQKSDQEAVLTEIGIETARHGDLERGLEILDQISKTSVTRGAYVRIAKTNWRDGDHGTSRYVLEHAEARTRALKDEEELASGIVSIAMTYANIGDVETARRFLDEFPEFLVKRPAGEEGAANGVVVVTGFDDDPRMRILVAIARAHVQGNRFGEALEIAAQLQTAYPDEGDRILLDVVAVIYRQDWPSEEKAGRLALAAQLLDQVKNTDIRNSSMRCEAWRHSANGDWDRATLALDAMDGLADWFSAYRRAHDYWETGREPCGIVV